MLESIIALLGIEYKQSTHRVDIAKGQYKLPENRKELLQAIKMMNKQWKSSRSK